MIVNEISKGVGMIKVENGGPTLGGAWGGGRGEGGSGHHNLRADEGRED